MDARMSNAFFRVCLAAVVFSVAMSCGRPAEDGQFIRKSSLQDDGTYRFKVSMDDSLRKHSLALFAVIDVSGRDFESMPQVIWLQIDAVSPSGKLYSEKVGLDKDSHIRDTFFSRQYESVYRSGFSPVEYGEWTIGIKMADEDSFPGLRGIGLKHSEE